jgi:hypothetical protein
MNGEVRAAVLLVQGTASVTFVRAAAVDVGAAAFGAGQLDVLWVLCVRVEPGGLNPELLRGGGAFCINAKGGASVVV